jgi:RNA polymerase sigma factor (TIGR02999 family)
MSTPAQDVTQLLVAWSDGDKAALDQLMPLVYDELRRLARHYMNQEHGGHTLQTTALINEAYLRLVDQRMSWRNRAHFFGIAAQMMRRILVDHARSHQYAKRGAGQPNLALDEVADIAHERAAELIALDDALTALAAMDPQQAQIVELRYFGGLTIEETAEVMDISHATVEREWNMARAWLRSELTK